MQLATSTGYGIYLIMWIPCLLLVAGVGFQSLYSQILSGRRAETIWRWQPWTLVITAGIAMTIHCIGLTQLIDSQQADDPNYLADGMNVIRFVDTGYYVILGIGVLLLVATSVVRGIKTKHQKEATQAAP